MLTTPNLEYVVADIMAINFEQKPHSVAVDPIRKLVYVGTSDSLKIIDADTLEIIKSLSFGFDFYEVTVNSEANRVYVTHLVQVNRTGFSAEYHISIMNATTHDLMASITVGGQDEWPVILGLDEDNDRLYFRKGSGPTVYALEGSSGIVSTAFKFERETVFAIDYATNLMYTSSYDSDGPVVLSVVNSTNLAKVGNDVVLDAPDGSYIIPIVLDSQNQLLYVPILNRYLGQELTIPTGTIYIFDISGNNLTLKKNIEMHAPTRLVVDEQTDAFYILDVEAGLYSIDSETYARHLITDGGRLVGDYALDNTTGILYLLDRTSSKLHAYSREQLLGLYWTGESLNHFEPSMRDKSGEELQTIHVGQTGAITVTVHNLEDQALEAILLIEVRDGNGITMFLALQRVTIPAGLNYTMQTSWTPDRVCWASNPGCENHLIRTFALSLTQIEPSHFDYVKQSEILVVQ